MKDKHDMMTMISLSEEFYGSVTDKKDLLEVYNFVKEILGPDIITFEQFVHMQEHNDEISHNIRRPNGELCGFLSLSFLTASAFKQLENKSLRTMELSGEHQVLSNTVPAAIYVGAVGASEDRSARKSTMEYFNYAMSYYEDKFPQAAVLMRPVTESGLRVAGRSGFIPFHEQSGLGHLYIKDCLS